MSISIQKDKEARKLSYKIPFRGIAVGSMFIT